MQQRSTSKPSGISKTSSSIQKKDRRKRIGRNGTFVGRREKGMVDGGASGTRRSGRVHTMSPEEDVSGAEDDEEAFWRGFAISEGESEENWRAIRDNEEEEENGKKLIVPFLVWEQLEGFVDVMREYIQSATTRVIAPGTNNEYSILTAVKKLLPHGGIGRDIPPITIATTATAPAFVNDTGTRTQVLLDTWKGYEALKNKLASLQTGRETTKDLLFPDVDGVPSNIETEKEKGDFISNCLDGQGSGQTKSTTKNFTYNIKGERGEKLEVKITKVANTRVKCNVILTKGGGGKLVESGDVLIPAGGWTQKDSCKQIINTFKRRAGDLATTIAQSPQSDKKLLATFVLIKTLGDNSQVMEALSRNLNVFTIDRIFYAQWLYIKYLSTSFNVTYAGKIITRNKNSPSKIMFTGMTGKKDTATYEAIYQKGGKLKRKSKQSSGNVITFSANHVKGGKVKRKTKIRIRKTRKTRKTRKNNDKRTRRKLRKHKTKRKSKKSSRSRQNMKK